MASQIVASGASHQSVVGQRRHAETESNVTLGRSPSCSGRMGSLLAGQLATTCAEGVSPLAGSAKAVGCWQRPLSDSCGIPLANVTLKLWQKPLCHSGCVHPVHRAEIRHYLVLQVHAAWSIRMDLRREPRRAQDPARVRAVPLPHVARVGIYRAVLRCLEHLPLRLFAKRLDNRCRIPGLRDHEDHVWVPA